MALSASTRNPQIIRFNFSADDASAGFNYSVSRTLAIADATAIFSTSAAAQNILVRKTAATCVTIPTNNVPNEVRQATTLDLANAYFVSGDTMNFITSNAALRGVCHVTVLPGTTSTS
jgi:hypothetical protein